jgi:hypothetical protein
METRVVGNLKGKGECHFSRSRSSGSMNLILGPSLHAYFDMQ